MDSIYELLMALPLLHGVSKQRILDIVGKTKFHFLKYLPGEDIITPGDPCTHMKFLLSGSIRVVMANEDMRFRVGQTLRVPTVIAPQFLFGHSPFYPCSVRAIDTTGILQIDKADYLTMLETDKVFMLNYLNLISTAAQRSVEGILALTSGDLAERIAYWIAALTQREGEEVVLSCRQRDLYSLFGVPRSSLIAALDKLKEEGIVDYAPQEIRVLSRPRLMALLSEVDD